MEDSFLKYAGPVSASRKEANAWHYQGTREPDGRWADMHLYGLVAEDRAGTVKNPACSR